MPSSVGVQPSEWVETSGICGKCRSWTCACSHSVSAMQNVLGGDRRDLAGGDRYVDDKRGVRQSGLMVP